MINEQPYKDMIQQQNKDLAEITKIPAFRKALVFFIYNQLIKGGYEHYVVLIGQDYMVQVKYRKGSMIKINLQGFTLLLYEVPYIAVPTLPSASQVSDDELSKLEKSSDDSIKIEVKKYFCEEDSFDRMQPHIKQALLETIQWYQQSEAKDPRNDNLSGVMLSRFMKHTDNYHWHILFGDIVPENSAKGGPGSLIEGHQIRQKRMKEMVQPVSRIKLLMYTKFVATFSFKSKKNGKVSNKKVEVIVFNQCNNPQTSVQSFFSNFRSLNPKSLFTTNALAVIAFLCILGMFFIQKRLCYEEPKGTNPQELGIPRGGAEDIMMDPSDEPETLGFLQSLCRAKNSFMTNLGVAFLLLTVIRQLVIRFNAKKDRIRPL